MRTLSEVVNGLVCLSGAGDRGDVDDVLRVQVPVRAVHEVAQAVERAAVQDAVSAAQTALQY